MEYKPHRRPEPADRSARPSGSKRAPAAEPRATSQRTGGRPDTRTATSKRGEGDFSARAQRSRFDGERSGHEEDAYMPRSYRDASGEDARESRPRFGYVDRFGTLDPQQGGKRGAPPRARRRRRDPAAIIVPIVIAIVVLAGVIYTGSSWLISTLNRSTYLSNIYVNGIDISPYSKEEGKEYVHQQIEQRLNATHTLNWQGSQWSFSAADFGGSIETGDIMERAWNIGHTGNIFDRSATVRELKRNPIYLTAPLNFDSDAVDNFVNGIYDQLYVAPRNAEVAANLDSPYLAVESSAGQELDRETARAQIVNLLENGEGGDVLPVLTLEPAVSTEEAMSTLELAVEYRTDVSARGYDSRFNVRKGLGYFYGMIVQPGEEVSFNSVVGPRTEERGWMLGTEYIGGGKSQEGYGGGICQASTTLYGALIKAGMTILEREAHSMTVAYVEPSCDAAVTETSSKDLRFRNDTENPIIIYPEVTREYATVRIYGVKPKYRYELESTIIRQSNGAMNVSYIDDVDGKICYYKDETALYKEGHAACVSEGWVVAYDWDTGEEVERKQLSHDEYASGYDIYWRGVHSRDEAKGGKAAEAPTPAPDVAASFD